MDKYNKLDDYYDKKKKELKERIELELLNGTDIIYK